MFIDTHCHLDDPKLISDLDTIVSEFQKERVSTSITMGCEKDTSYLCRDISEKYSSVYFGAGVHPMDAHKILDGDIISIEKLLTHPKCVCVGEVGVDLYWDKTHLDAQKEVFNQMIELAHAYKLPMSVHMRDATKETIDLLKQNKGKLTYGGVLHCYAGSKETLKEVLDIGFYIGFGGTLTFKNARNVLEVAKVTPLDRILTETDSPYLSPEPKRGTINSPKNVVYVTAKLSEILGIEIEKLAEIITKNAKTVFSKL